ncbi:hypothetical protein CASFOL_027453 [Castilleja foliolosa]|uniref:Uncharacterized protein n=1 Tax=Castilleja foliolosa TaxID=1961234 RepID=A0ABD3CFR0_9LAMI
MGFLVNEAIKVWNIVLPIGNFLKMIHNIIIKETDHSLSADEIKRRMAGIYVYKLSNYKEGEERERDARKERYEHDIFIVSKDDSKAVSFYFISKPDALDFFDKIKLSENYVNGWRIIDTPLSNIMDEEGDEGVAVRLVPELSQIKNAIEEKWKETGTRDNYFTGVPVFMSSNLRPHLTRTGERLRLAFLRKLKEDLQERLTALGVSPGTIKVVSLEETIQEMKDSSTSKSNDILFVGHGDTRRYTIRRLWGHIMEMAIRRLWRHTIYSQAMDMA